MDRRNEAAPKERSFPAIVGIVEQHVAALAEHCREEGLQIRTRFLLPISAVSSLHRADDQT